MTDAGWAEKNADESINELLKQAKEEGRQEVLESFARHHDECFDFRHCECSSGFWYEHIGKLWMDEKQQAKATALQRGRGGKG